MSDITLFAFEDQLVRTVLRSGEPWFVAQDVASLLGYEKPRNAIATHCKGALKQGIPTNGGEQEMTVIPERDVYRLIMRSKLPAAEAFEDWVVGEVLPSLRKTGAYATSGATAEDDQRRLWVDTINLALQVHGVGAARALWAQSPLPGDFAAAGAVNAQACLDHLLDWQPRYEPQTLRQMAQGWRQSWAQDQVNLRRYGLFVAPHDRPEMLAVSEHYSCLTQHYRDTPWYGGWGEVLRIIPGAWPRAESVYVGEGLTMKAALLPLSVLDLPPALAGPDGG